MCTYHQDHPKISQSSVLTQSLATVLARIVRYGLVLYWIPILSVIGLIALGNFLVSASSQWSYNGFAWFTIIVFFMLSWFAAGVAFVIPTALRNEKYYKVFIRFLLLPFFVIPTYFKHRSEWFDDAVSEICALWHTLSFRYLIGYYVIFCGVGGIVSPHFSSKQDWLIFPFVAMLAGYFFHVLVTLRSSMRGRSWRTYFWLLLTHISLMTAMNLVMIIATAVLYFVQGKPVIHGELDIAWSIAVIPFAFAYATLFLDLAYMVTRVFQRVWRCTRSLFGLTSK